MNAGWSWQIEHEFHVNRGYVYASGAISDDEACQEFLTRNPKAPKSPRVVKFRSGCYQRTWVDNVVAIGNAAGFVEPLEATALMVVCSEVQTLIELLKHCALEPTPTMRGLFNKVMTRTWEEIRDFLALHYKLNTQRDTPFWQQCREETDVSNIGALLEFYRENGPTGFGRHMLPSAETDFGMEGYLVMLVGNKMPYQGRHTASAAERTLWDQRRQANLAQAQRGMDIKEALGYIRHPGWRWNGDPA
jgi:tryptophan 7-halogenase